tara:strand:- start:6433 stop:6615 length:183 start_codon:yes stop_codon:yes gene_type:complete
MTKDANSVQFKQIIKQMISVQNKINHWEFNKTEAVEVIQELRKVMSQLKKKAAKFKGGNT